MLIFACVAASLPFDVQAQIRPVYDRGTTGLMQLLKRLNTTASVLMIGAHPDDEDTALLAYLARGENARTAYLSLTRGDGGQNIIGPELGEALGVIRTEELLQARKLDGAEQYFTRAYDYGFSKTLAEAKEKWDEKAILCDTVRVIRDFRPLVVVSQFSGTTADGHGHHQFAGYISPLAVKAASDASQCTESGPPWVVKRFFVRHRGSGEPMLRINTGKYDPLFGRSYFEIAMEARSQHRSQEQGVLELRGAQFSSMNLQSSEATESCIFEGLDLSVRAVGKGVKDFEQPLSEIHDLAEKALREYDALSPQLILPYLVKGYQIAHKAGLYTHTEAGYSPAAEFARSMASKFVEAIVAASGLQIDALSDVETIAQGESFNVSVKAYSPQKEIVQIKGISLAFPAKPGIPPVANLSDIQWWIGTKRPAPTTNSPAFLAREVGMASEHFRVTVPRDADLTQPYWLVDPRVGDMFLRKGHWQNFDLAIQQPLPSAWVTLEIDGVMFSVNRPVEYRFADDVRGEIRRNVAVVPLVTLSLDQGLMIVAAGSKETNKALTVTVTNNSSAAVSGKVALDLPAGWSAATSEADLNLSRKGESKSVLFNIKVPANARPGNYSIRASATIGDTSYSRSVRTISYPHIQTHRFYNEAVTKANVVDLKTSPVRIGYIPGSGDSLPQAIAQMGLNVATIDERALASGDLSRFDVIVVGIRAYQVRTDIIAHNKRLIDFAANGGTLVVQYQLPGYAQQNLMPYPAQMGPRVSDENAAVNFAVPGHPILNYPNKIGPADFSNWVQERNLYNFSTMDPRYVGLLESHDPNEAENRGGLVVADIGKGKYVYCSYSLFRQLPAGVPGAYRLLANILSYKAEKGN